MENLDEWRKAGKLAGQALAYGKNLIKPGAKIVDVLDKIDDKIHALGGECAFPPQISMNAVAAHYYPEPDDDFSFSDELCCLDVGVHINGAIGDTAATVDLSGKYLELVKAAEEALAAAIKTAGPGVKLCEIGRAIQDTITGFGYAPVRNLSGHGLKRFEIHSEPSVPNYDDRRKLTLEKDMIIAIEPFATTGQGLIQESEDATIFSLVNKKPVRNIIARQVLAEISTYNALPFTTRTLTKKFPLGKAHFALRALLQSKIIKAYPPLVEVTKGMVAQAEHSLYIGDTVEVLTKL